MLHICCVIGCCAMKLLCDLGLLCLIVTYVVYWFVSLIGDFYVSCLRLWLCCFVVCAVSLDFCVG